MRLLSQSCCSSIHAVVLTVMGYLPPVCIAARSVEKGNADFMDGDVEGTAISMEQHEASFAAACTACRALRDLSALSKDFSAVVTDDILKVNEQWSTCVVEGKGYDCSSGGLVSDLLILLKHANDPTEIFKAPKKGRRTSFYLSSKRRRRGTLTPTIVSHTRKRFFALELDLH